MDLLDLAILALRIAIVAVLYFFLAFVVRASLRALRQPPGVRQAAVAAASRRLVLTVAEPAESTLQPGARFELQATTLIGRASSADLVVADAAVSAHHARVDRSPDGWVLVDLGSTNGTRLNNRAVHAAARLRAGDSLEVGPVRFDVSDT